MKYHKHIFVQNTNQIINQNSEFRKMCSIIMQMAVVHKLDSKTCGVFSNMKPATPPPSPSTRCSSSMQSSHIQTQRRSGGYRPALWDFDSIQTLNTTHDRHYKEERHVKRVEALIAQVKTTLLQEEEVDDVRGLELIDELHMLGVSCHFEKEIIHFLNLTYLNFNYETDDDQRNDLYSTSLRFRLLRKYGFTVSQEVFNCFKNEKGSEFQPSLAHDIKRVLQLYEASFLRKQGEHTLELAREFATKILQNKLDDDDDDEDGVLSSIRGVLEFPSHWRVQMPNARSFIDAYKRRPDMNLTLLELAELDINIVQAQFQEELKEASRWWESTSLVEQLPFVRDRIVECYMWTTGVLQRREHGYERVMLTKINALVTTIDDVYDVYGTLEELNLFTTAIQRWDVESLDQLPAYMKLCYLALYNFVHDMAYQTLKEKGFNSIPYLRKAWVDLAESYLIEAKWYHSGHKPRLEEYMKNAWISVGGVPVLSHLFFRLSESTEKEVVESMHKYHDIVRASCTITRLADDMGTSLDEVERGDVPKSIQCYMNEKNASEEEARAHVRGVIEQTWAEMNTELLMDDEDDDDSQSQILFPKAYVEAVANLARMAQFMYQDESDGFGMQHSKVNKLLRDLLFEP